MKDSGMKTSYSGSDGTKGLFTRGISKDKNVGAGVQEITKINEASRIDYELRFLRPIPNITTSAFILNKIGENTLGH